jgi:hypothetical protein
LSLAYLAADAAMELDSIRTGNARGLQSVKKLAIAIDAMRKSERTSDVLLFSKVFDNIGRQKMSTVKDVVRESESIAARLTAVSESDDMQTICELRDFSLVVSRMARSTRWYRK